MTPSVSPASSADTSAIIELLDEAAIRQEQLGSPMWSVGQFRDEVPEAIRSRTMFVAREDDVVVGCFVLDRCGARMERWLLAHDRSPEDGIVVGRVAVARRIAGTGTGALLLAIAALTVTEDGHPHLWLECPADNERLRRHYEAAGFSHIGDNDEPGRHGEPWISSVYERSTRS